MPWDIILHLCTRNDDHMVYGSWDIKPKQTELFVILGYFFPIYPPNNPENQNFEKMEKNPGVIIILHMSTINENHMKYDSRDKECDRFFSHLDNFLPFYRSSLLPAPLNNPENQNFENMKKSPGDFIILKSVP